MVEPSARAQPSASPAGASPASAARSTGCAGGVAAMISIGIGALYLLNPFAGMIELLPDNFPIIGNLDEAGAAGMVIFGLQYLARMRREKRALRDAATHE